jgi:hypothetical protein
MAAANPLHTDQREYLPYSADPKKGRLLSNAMKQAAGAAFGCAVTERLPISLTSYFIVSKL